jgi:hypothetical protein
LLRGGAAARLAESMAANEPYSDEFAATARQEVERLAVRASEFRVRGERWIERGEGLLDEAERLAGKIRDLDELLGRAPQLRLDLQTIELQGQQLREAATQILMQQRGLRNPIHYREWYALMNEAGLVAVGKDPLATFLTQITRSPIISRVGGAAGTYQLDPVGAYDRARAAVAQATRAVNDVRVAVPSDRETAERAVTDAKRQLASAERQLDEVVEARTVLRQAHFVTLASAVAPRR